MELIALSLLALLGMYVAFKALNSDIGKATSKGLQVQINTATLTALADSQRRIKDEGLDVDELLKLETQLSKLGGAK